MNPSDQARQVRTDMDRVIAEYRAFLSSTSTVRWNLKPRSTVSDRYADAAMAATLEKLGTTETPKEFLDRIGLHDLPEGALDPIYETYMQSLREDMAECMTPEQQQMFATVGLAFMPIGASEAVCFAEDTMRNRLATSLIIVNDGLYYCLQQLFTALIFEEMQGDLAVYQRDGSEAFKWAYRLFTNPSSALVGRVELDLQNPADQGEAQAYLSMVTTITMQFIGLHEFGHAWLGHHDLQGKYRLFLTGGPDDIETVVTALDIEHEYEADEFALRCILARSNNTQSRWANFYAISFFFEFLAVVEDRGGHRLLRSHPPASDRLKRLRNLMSHTAGEAEQYAYLEDRAAELTKKWSASVMNNFFNLVVEANSTRGLLEQFTDEQKQISPIEGADVEFLGQSRGKGILETKDIILLGIGYAGALPVNLLSSWLFEKLKPSTANVVVIKVDGAEAANTEELAALLERKLKDR